MSRTPSERDDPYADVGRLRRKDADGCVVHVDRLLSSSPAYSEHAGDGARIHLVDAVEATPPWREVLPQQICALWPADVPQPSVTIDDCVRPPGLVVTVHTTVLTEPIVHALTHLLAARELQSHIVRCAVHRPDLPSLFLGSPADEETISPMSKPPPLLVVTRAATDRWWTCDGRRVYASSVCYADLEALQPTFLATITTHNFGDTIGLAIGCSSTCPRPSADVPGGAVALYQEKKKDKTGYKNPSVHFYPFYGQRKTGEKQVRSGSFEDAHTANAMANWLNAQPRVVKECPGAARRFLHALMPPAFTELDQTTPPSHLRIVQGAGDWAVYVAPSRHLLDTAPRRRVVWGQRTSPRPIEGVIVRVTADYRGSVLVRSYNGGIVELLNPFSFEAQTNDPVQLTADVSQMLCADASAAPHGHGEAMPPPVPAGRLGDEVATMGDDAVEAATGDNTAEGAVAALPMAMAERAPASPQLSSEVELTAPTTTTAEALSAAHGYVDAIDARTAALEASISAMRRLQSQLCDVLDSQLVDSSSNPVVAHASVADWLASCASRVIHFIERDRVATAAHTAWVDVMATSGE